MAEAGIAKVKDRDVWLIGGTCSEITGSKLPSNCQVLARFFHLHLNEKHTIEDSAVSTTGELLQFWMKARIATRQDYNIVVKLKDLHGKWKALKKGASNMSGNQRSKETAFVDSLDDLFDVAHADAMKLINIEEYRKFLEAQKEKGRRGCMGAVDTVLPQSQMDGQTDKLFENILVPIPISSYTSRTFRTSTVQCFRVQSLL